MTTCSLRLMRKHTVFGTRESGISHSGIALRSMGNNQSSMFFSAMGKSRSATLVIAYLLSIHPEPTSSSVQECLNLVRQTHPIAEPNSGFENQLNLYARMGCPDDIHTNPEYQRWLYKQEATNSLSTRQAPSNVYFADKAEKSITPDYESEYETEWKCKKCRRSLARKEFEEKHVPKAQSPDERSSTRKPKVPSLNHRHESSDRHSKPLTSSVAMFEDSLGSPEARESCAHIFLYPLLWMKEELEAEKLEGRLECPNSKCRANVGKYAWQGLQCSCGKWVVPAIALARGRVDEMKVRRNLGVGVSKKGQEAMEQEVGGLKI